MKSLNRNNFQQNYPAYLAFFSVFLIGLQTFNTSAPFTEGWWHVYARWIDMGKIPYRDFELLVPPGYPFLLWVISKVFGETFVIIRFLGVIVQSITAVIIYRLLWGKVSNLVTSFVSVFGTLLLYSGVASVPFDYNYIAVLFSLLAFERTKYLVYRREENIRRSSLSLIGVLTSITFLVKQSFGLSTLVFVSMAILLTTFFNFRKFLGLYSWFVFAFIAPLLMIAFYLQINNALIPSLEQVFINATETKGGGGQILYSWVLGIYTPESLSGAIRFIFLVSVLALTFRYWIQRLRNKSTSQTNRLNPRRMFILSLLIFLSFMIVMLLLRYTSYLNLTQINHVLGISRNHFFVDPLLICIVILILPRKNPENRSLIVSTLAAISFFFGTGMSGGISEFGIFLSVSIGIIFVISLIGKSLLMELGFVAFLIVLIIGLTAARLDAPYSWWNYNVSSAKSVTTMGTLGLSNGLHFSPAQLEIYNRLNKFVQESKSTCGSQIYVYPAMPLFQLNAGILPPGYLGNYWFDFSSRSGIERQLKFIEDHGIDALVYLEVPDYVTKAHSELFQGGEKLAQTKLAETFNNYLSSLPTNSISRFTVDGIDGEFSIGPLECSTSESNNIGR
jgi:hypothetical protein